MNNINKYPSLIAQYIKRNGAEDMQFDITESEELKITKWEYDFAQPTLEDLKEFDAEESMRELSKRIEWKESRNILIVDDDEELDNRLARPGTIVFNKSKKTLHVFDGESWIMYIPK